mmetsp:Transcript_26887/g.75749  ORF Transcript_26887/g.75749 Transcript_26887/m.75749 type:complete len:86 (-) Transcript_26887:190-447(-)
MNCTASWLEAAQMRNSRPGAPAADARPGEPAAAAGEPRQEGDEAFGAEATNSARNTGLLAARTVRCAGKLRSAQIRTTSQQDPDK